MKKIYLLIAFNLFVFYNTYSQVKTLNYKHDFFKGSTAITSVRLNKDAIAFVSNDGDKAVEITCTDNGTNIQWSTQLEGYVRDAKLLGENLLIIVSTDFTVMTSANSTYKAYLVGARKGNLLKSKVLFSGNNDFHTIPYVLISKDKKTLTLATRETAVKRNVKIGVGTLGALYTIKRTIDQSNKIKSFNVLTFDDNLEEKGAISPVLPDGDFIGIQKTLNDDMYIAVSQNKQGITISQYLPGSEKALKSINETFSYYSGMIGTEHLNEQIKFFADTLSGNAIYITGSFKTGDEYVSIFNKYDFVKNQHKRFKKVFNKSEIKEMEKAFKPVNKEFKKLSLGGPKCMELQEVVVHKDGYFLIISDESVTAPGQYSGPVPYSEGIIVYSLDRELIPKTISTIPRYFVGYPKPCLKIYLKDNSVYIFASHETHANFIIAKVNLISGKVENLQLTEPSKAGRTDYSQLSEAIMSDDRILLPVLDPKLSMLKVKSDIQLYQLAW